MYINWHAVAALIGYAVFESVGFFLCGWRIWIALHIAGAITILISMMVIDSPATKDAP